MNTLIIKNRTLITFAIPLFLIVSIIILANSSVFQLHPNELSIGITLDLLLFIPAIYFLLIRKSEISKITTVPFFIAGIIIASFIIPKDFQFYLTQAKTWVLPVIETSIFFLVIYKASKLKKELKKDLSQTFDFYSSLKKASAQILPNKLSVAFATEIAVIYYGFFNWKKRVLSENEFSYHKSSGTMALLSVFIFLILIETSVMHLLLVKWSIVAAWILSIISIYTSMQIFGLMRSMNKRPISIENNLLKLRYGLFSESTISLSNIKNIELSTKAIEFNNSTKKLSPLRDLESHNVVIELKEEDTLLGLYGFKSTYTTLAFYVDDAERFDKELTKAIQH